MGLVELDIPKSKLELFLERTGVPRFITLESLSWVDKTKGLYLHEKEGDCYVYELVYFDPNLVKSVFRISPKYYED